MKKFFLLGMIALLGFAACKKDKKTTPNLENREEYLTAAPWYIEALADTMPDACFTDDKYVFKSEGAFTLDVGTPCPGQFVSHFNGSWEFLNGNTKLKINTSLLGNLLADTLDIITLDENTFEFVGNGVLFEKAKMKH